MNLCQELQRPKRRASACENELVNLRGVILSGGPLLLRSEAPQQSTTSGDGGVSWACLIPTAQASFWSIYRPFYRTIH